MVIGQAPDERETLPGAGVIFRWALSSGWVLEVAESSDGGIREVKIRSDEGDQLEFRSMATGNESVMVRLIETFYTMSHWRNTVHRAITWYAEFTRNRPTPDR